MTWHLIDVWSARLVVGVLAVLFFGQFPLHWWRERHPKKGPTWEEREAEIAAAEEQNKHFEAIREKHGGAVYCCNCGSRLWSSALSVGKVFPLGDVLCVHCLVNGLEDAP